MALRAFTFFLVAISAVGCMQTRAPGINHDYRQLTTVDSLPVALDEAFAFRKTKTFTLGPTLPGRRDASGGGRPSPMLEAEASYRLYGAVTQLDQQRRYGQYFDFFWRGRRATPVTVRFEYRQDALRGLTQAREVSYADGKGSHKTSFAIIGDDYSNDGRVIAWRCLLIAGGQIVAEERSFLWR